MDLKLKGKVALITGSSKGLGYATALLLAKEGSLVAVNSRNAENIRKAAKQINRETGANVLAIPGDLNDPEIPEQIISKTVEEFGGLDILIANAGGPPSGRFESLDDIVWQKAFELVFMSQVRLIRSALPYLKKSAAPSVLTFTSYAVKQPIPNLVLSNSLRNGVIGLTKSLALELGDLGIRVNSILPAWTMTERITELLGFRAKTHGTTLEEEAQKQSMDSPFGRMASADEVANAAVFLVSPAASYITGVMLPVDGGMYKGMV
jgi:3-oxoacyl-[acyl-carrier protein] reductase